MLRSASTPVSTCTTGRAAASRLTFPFPAGRAVARRLITAADVFVTNLRQKALTRLELDSATLRAAAPQLVYAQVTGYGDADEENRRSYDHGAFWSYSGMAALFRDSAGTPPQPAGGMGDRASGSALAGAVCAALFARQRTGRGEHVSVSLLSTAMWLMASDAADALRSPAQARGNDRLSAPIPTVNCFRCADGRWLWLQSMLPERDWDALLTALDARWLDDDPRFSGGDGRLLAQGRTALTEALDEIFRQRSAAEWCRRLSCAGLTVAEVRELSEAVRDPLVLGSGAIQAGQARRRGLRHRQLPLLVRERSARRAAPRARRRRRHRAGPRRTRDHPIRAHGTARERRRRPLTVRPPLTLPRARARPRAGAGPRRGYGSAGSPRSGPR